MGFDADNELTRAKWLLGAVALFLVSSCLSWGEVAYLLWGRDAQATITKAFTSSAIRSRTVRLTVEYEFTEPDGTRRGGTVDLSPDWPVPASGKVAVRYMPGENGRSRLSGHVHWLGLTLFGLSVGAMGIFAYQMHREANEPARGTRRKR
ncbi:DUF3592 domain-containing protein [Tuwongella immobilis]|uniref:DUF3592 domain-containing protein n=1 Tax=Tuwongella immobilis TaxID=692036 RepID=A0A6C2YKX3_9BACT|nr:DUF3592 domain-containing protein [Tuwongella immobilis]VIP01763.1 unnamed protein product [Tuwongella immobilis]VTR99376.1 unnamed protein product [Tuwongella immobilis]